MCSGKCLVKTAKNSALIHDTCIVNSKFDDSNQMAYTNDQTSIDTIVFNFIMKMKRLINFKMLTPVLVDYVQCSARSHIQI